MSQTTTMNFVLEKESKKKIVELAEKDGRSPSSYMRKIANDYLKTLNK